jgi:ADP-ribose pyrophosphatase
MSWKTLNTKIIEANQHLRFMVDEFDADGRRGKYFYHTNAYGETAVNIFVQKSARMFLMIREYRYLLDGTTLSMPQGSVEPGETEEAAARREVVEECGYEPGTLTFLGWFATAPAFSKERVYLYLASDVKEVGQKLDEKEEIETVELTVEQIDEAILNGEMWDGQAIAGWYKVKQQLGL